MAHYLSQRIEDQIWIEPNDLPFLRTRVSEAQTQIESLEDRTDELNAQISELKRQKDAKLAEIASYRNVLSPIRRIPPEILCEIFELARQVNWDIVNSTYILCQVCVAWQKIAHAHPRLWSIICLSPTWQNINGEVPWVKKWISRSQSLPLDFHLDFTSIYSSAVTRILEYIVDCFHQIRLLDLRGPLSLFLPILTLPCSSLHLLEEVEVSLTRIASHQNKIEMFLGASKLRKVSVVEDRLDPGSAFQTLAIHVEQLTSLKIDAHDLSMQLKSLYADVLHRCKNLVNLETRCVGFGTQLSISLPALKSLHVSCHMAIGSVNILCCLTTPLLEHLIISQVDQNLDDVSTDVAGLKHRSMCSVLSLALVMESPSYAGTSDLIAILSLFPTIRSFQLHWATFDLSPLLQALTHRDDHFLLPKLTGLELNNPRAQSTDDGFSSALRSMILSRWWPVTNPGLESDRNGWLV
ncbi:hypothetical protein BT96DRAFT_885831 [Gymnopus androsaceus JB14]|uniref:Uncharacterized protein n=1 Tax=Gymnopus androsaceus JB14 TaxID=1447944 RepID=A0A6A4HC10_9AGAR|nr:hypothetical protein BT96DRAFT_885831 [Gymnopus androsaceus JB14]